MSAWADAAQSITAQCQIYAGFAKNLWWARHSVTSSYWVTVLTVKTATHNSFSAARESQFGRVPLKSMESRGLSKKRGIQLAGSGEVNTGYNLYTSVIAEIPMGRVPEIRIPSSPTTKVSKLKLKNTSSY